MLKKIGLILLTLVLPGGSHILRGFIRRGLIFLALPYLLTIPIWLFKIELPLWMLYGMVLADVTIRIYALIDYFALPEQPDNTCSNMKTVGLLLSALVLRALINPVGALQIDTFHITNPTMYPSLRFGDMVVCHTNQATFHYGDIVAFETEEFGMWSYRVIGLPRDSIRVVDHDVFVNGKPLKKNLVRTTNDDISSGKIYEERSADGFTYRVHEYDRTLRPDQIFTDTLGEEEYYLLGDNRDNAEDSRFIGPVDAGDIYGKISYVYWSDDVTRINTQFGR